MNIKKKKIKDLLRMNGLKQKEAAEQIGVSTQTFNNWMFRKVFPNFDYLKKLADLLNTSPSELITNKKVNETQAEYTTASKIENRDHIPLYTQEPSINRLSFWADETVEEPKDFVSIPGLKANFIFVFYGSGMSSLISNGDWMALRRINDYSFFNYGEMHLIITKEQALVRNIRKSQKNDHLILTSENDFSDEMELSTESIHSIFIIVSIIKRIIL